MGYFSLNRFFCNFKYKQFLFLFRLNVRFKDYFLIVSYRHNCCIVKFFLFFKSSEIILTCLLDKIKLKNIKISLYMFKRLDLSINSFIFIIFMLQKYFYFIRDFNRYIFRLSSNIKNNDFFFYNELFKMIIYLLFIKRKRIP